MGKRFRDDEEKKEPVVTIPVDIIHESFVIAAAFASRRCRSLLVKKGVRIEHFGNEKHKEIWRCLLECERANLDNDAANVQSFSSTVDARYLLQVSDARPEAPSDEDLAHHAEGLFWDAARAKFVEGPLDEVIAALKDPREHPDRIRGIVRKMNDALNGFGSSRHILSTDDVVRALAEELDRRRREDAVWPFGIRGLDEYEEEHPKRRRGRKWRVAPGSMPGLLTVITALTGAGKTTTVANMILGMIKRRRRVLWGVWEDPAAMNAETLAAIYLGLSREDLMVGNFDDETRDSVMRVVRNMSEQIRFFGLPFGREIGKKSSNERNLDVVHQHVADSGCDVFVADIWNRCLVDRSPEGEENAIIRTQGIAQETGVHIIATHQLRFKDLEKREDFKPTREGLKGSGAIVETADYLFGVHNPDLFKPVAKPKIEIHCLKRRRGPWPWAIEFDFDPDRGIISGGKTIPHDAGPSRKKGKRAADEFAEDDEPNS